MENYIVLHHARYTNCAWADVLDNYENSDIAH